MPEKKSFWKSITGEIENEELLDNVFREAHKETEIEKDNVLKIIKNVNKVVYSAVKKNLLD